MSSSQTSSVKGNLLTKFFFSLFKLQIGTHLGSVCTLADSALTKKSSIKVCDSFKVNILLASPDKKWIAAGTKDNDDLSPKVCLVVFGRLTLFGFPTLVFSAAFSSTV